MTEPIERFPVSLAWHMADDTWVKVVYNARVVSYEADKDRWLVVLEGMADPPTPNGAPAETRELIERLAGKWAYVPDAARDGVTLPLKYGTLTGERRYFYASDPREQG